MSNNKGLIAALGIGAIVFLLSRPRQSQAITANGLSSPPDGTIVDRLFPWFRSQRGTNRNQPVISGVQRTDNIGQYIQAGGKAAADLVRAVADIWPRQKAKAPTVTGSTSAPSIVPLTSTGGTYYDWNAFDSFLTGPQGPIQGPIDRPNYVIDWNKLS